MTFAKFAGGHVIMKKGPEPITITVPVPAHPELRVGTLQSILRQSGVPRAAFEA